MFSTIEIDVFRPWLPFLKTKKAGLFTRPGKTGFRFGNKGCGIVRIWEQRTLYVSFRNVSAEFIPSKQSFQLHLFHVLLSVPSPAWIDGMRKGTDDMRTEGGPGILCCLLRTLLHFPNTFCFRVLHCGRANFGAIFIIMARG